MDRYLAPKSAMNVEVKDPPQQIIGLHRFLDYPSGPTVRHRLKQMRLAIGAISLLGLGAVAIATKVLR